jgi:hypothetical protein
MGVRLRHPTLESEIEVPAEAVPHHERSGWVQVKGQAEQGETWPEELQRFEGQEQVRMRHPDLDGEIVVARSAEPYWRERAWEEITDEAPADDAQPGEGLAGKTVPELRELAKQAGISPLPSTKDELLAALGGQPD